MLAAVDVHYAGDLAVAGCVVFDAWTDGVAREERVHRRPAPARYQPGRFFLRELPSVVAVVGAIGARPDVVIVDGYVWLGSGRRGLGAHVHDALDGVPVVGVAKRPFRGATPVEVRRGRSARPLYVTSVGLEDVEAARHVGAMHGAHRIPTLLKRVDRLCRDASRGDGR